MQCIIKAESAKVEFAFLLGSEHWPLFGLLMVNGQLLIPAGSGKHSWVAREDCARAAAGALVGRLAVYGPVDVTGPEALSFTDLAQRLASIYGYAVPTQVLSNEELLAQLVAKGIPEATAGFMVGFTENRAGKPCDSSRG